MKRRQLATMMLFRRARDFLERAAPTTAYGEVAKSATLLGETADRIAALAAEQETCNRLARAGTLTIGQRMRTLRWELMQPIALTARSPDVGDASLAEAMRIAPRIRRPEALATAAHAMADAALPRRERFVAAGYPPDFIERLHAAAVDVSRVVDERANLLARRAAATAGMADAVSRGRAILSMLDAMVGPSVEYDDALSAEWRAVLRAGRARRARGEVEAPPGASGA